jgi:AcrR family transcriptional regulator
MGRALILGTVVDLLEANGLEGLSMPAIAKASGVSLRTLYRYFPTRDDLLIEAGGKIKDRMGLSDAIPGVAEIPASFWANSARAARHPRLARALIASSAGRTARNATRSNRVSAIEEAMRELTDRLPQAHAVEAVGVIAYLCSSNSWLTISEECGVRARTARRGVVWALETLLEHLREEARAGPDPVR